MPFLPPNQQRQSTEGKTDGYTTTANNTALAWRRAVKKNKDPTVTTQITTAQKVGYSSSSPSLSNSNSLHARYKVRGGE